MQINTLQTMKHKYSTLIDELENKLKQPLRPITFNIMLEDTAMDQHAMAIFIYNKLSKWTDEFWVNHIGVTEISDMIIYNFGLEPKSILKIHLESRDFMEDNQDISFGWIGGKNLSINLIAYK